MIEEGPYAPVETINPINDRNKARVKVSVMIVLYPW